MDVFDYIKHGPKVAKTISTLSKGTGNLRGTRRRTANLSYNLSTQRQIAQLRRAINRNAAELQTYRRSKTNYTRTGTGIEATIDISLSELITADPNFRENVLGDKWRNKYVSLNFASNCDRVRVILYKPKDAGQSISLTSFDGLMDHIEPNAFTVLHDRAINIQSTNRANFFQWSLGKRLNFLTTINSQASDLVKSGDLRILVVTAGGVDDSVDMSVMMKFQNK